MIGNIAHQWRQPINAIGIIIQDFADALEFDEVLGTCDVLYDLAFLIMDLRHRDLGRAANMVLNSYSSIVIYG
jgi:aminoglycoside phosphotransferase family enzyme